MNFLHGNDKKRIKSALNDKKRNGVKLTIKEVFFGGTTSSSKMVPKFKIEVQVVVKMISGLPSSEDSSLSFSSS